MPAVRIAVLGAESTGKTTLAQALRAALADHTGARVAWVPEVLRLWCNNTGRTPLAHEQAAILRMQHQHIEEAAATHGVVVCDTTGLMTALYSQLIFADSSLLARAVALHRRMACTLLLMPDLPWVADGHQRDGPQMQQRVHQALLALLQQEALPFAQVAGAGDSRLQQALAAVLTPVLRAQTAAVPAAPHRDGLFRRLGAAPGGWAGGRERWRCDCCPVASSADPVSPAPRP
jgi:nicotinamide riboside kinase